MLMRQNAPILLFCYKRLECLRDTVNALKNCVLASESELYVFSDGAKSEKDRQKVDAVRGYIRDITGFKKITIKESEKNRGLAASIIQGVTEVINISGSVIVLEDDLVVSRNFLAYMNQGLDHYHADKRIFSMAGYTIPMRIPETYPYDVYFLPRASSWGWASWKDRWETIDWSVSDFAEFSQNRQKIREFNKGGSDMFTMLKKQMAGQIDSWAIRWCYHQFKVQTYTVFPTSSKVHNEGFTSDATNMHVYNRYHTELDKGNSLSFRFSDDVKLDQLFLGQFQRFYSIYTRAVSKVRTYIIKARHKANG
ncbi:MAG: glycosyltransferase [Bacteroidetes bacterium]|nr:glycosyltransferase [Bacteroidota bacterium]